MTILYFIKFFFLLPYLRPNIYLINPHKYIYSFLKPHLKDISSFTTVQPWENVVGRLLEFIEIKKKKKHLCHFLYKA